MTLSRYTAPDPQQRQDERNARNAAVMAQVRAQPKRGVSMGGGTARPAPKSEPRRNRALLDLARERRCLLRVPGVCRNDTGTTVACHSNLSIHGKAGARKADDCYSVWGCAACHRWLDQGPAPADAKGLAFTLAHLDQVLAWRRIAGDLAQPARDRKAAQWALDQLGATP